MEHLMRRDEVERITSLSRSAIYAAMTRGEFPRPVRVGRRAVAWPELAIKEWIDTRPLSEGW